MNSKIVLPYNDSDKSKKEQVAGMFDNISAKYDFLNHFLSLNIDKIWRRKAIKLLKPDKPIYILDVATGTGDFAFDQAKILNPEKIIGVDISKGMLEVGRQKYTKKNISTKIEFLYGDSENIEFPDMQFDAVTCAFGVRNFENLDKGLSEMYRVLKPNGKMVILEFSKPEKFPIKQIYNIYFNYILPKIGRIFSKDMSAYTYLPKSVEKFPYGDKFIDKLNQTGFQKNNYIKLGFGISSIYFAEKPSN